jgi:hypothetical protein
MSEPINLNHARKDRARAEAKSDADANAVKFARSKAQKILEATRNARAARALDSHLSEDE